MSGPISAETGVATVTSTTGSKHTENRGTPLATGRSRTFSYSIRRLVVFMLLLFLFVAVQIVQFHWRLKDHHLSLELSLELPDILEASKVHHYNNKISKQAKKSRVTRHSSPASDHEDPNRNMDVFKDIGSRKEGSKNGVKVFSRRTVGDYQGGREKEVAKGGRMVPKTLNRKKQNGLKQPKYLEDLTREEKFNYTTFNSSSLPVVRKLKNKHRNMRFYVIPTNRWSQMDNHTCIPSNRAFEEWEHRAPYALILGAQKAGSSALASYLYSHSQIVPTRKEFHFLSERMDYYNNDFEGIDQEQARSHYLRHIYSAMKMNHSSGIRDLSVHPNMHVLDATPMYLPKSDRVPHRVLCLCPWALLVVLLREPVSRAYSQYNMDAVHSDNTIRKSTDISKIQKKMSRLGTFDEFILRDYDTLLELGVLLPENAADSERAQHYGSNKESEAWKVYTKLGTPMPIGRSMYAIQLRQWINAYKAQNQPLRWLVLKSDDMKAQTESTYRKVLDFLDLQHELPKEFEEHHKHDYDHIKPMSKSTRGLLERIFEPYNRQLEDLVGPDWAGIWQYSDAQEVALVGAPKSDR